MNLREVLECGYYDENNGKDYIVEVSTNKLRQWFKQENLDLLDFNNNMPKKIAVYKILEKEFTKNLDQYQNFTVKFN